MNSESSLLSKSLLFSNSYPARLKDNEVASKVSLFKGVKISSAYCSSSLWTHIVENHDDIAGYYFEVLETVANPAWIFEGDEEEIWAARLVSTKKAMLVIYKEVIEQNDGFIITAFFTTKIRKLLRVRRIIWQQQRQ